MPPKKRPPAADEPAASDAEPDAPARSDLQKTDKPCSICYPDDWPEHVFSLGCEHGTWIRKQPD